MPRDVTQRAKEIIKGNQNPRKVEVDPEAQESPPRVLLKSTFSLDKRGVKVKSRGTEHITYNRTDIDLRDLEQLIDPNQTNTICFIMQYIMKKIVNDKITVAEVVAQVYQEVITKGLDVVSPFKGHPGNMALPRKHEIAGTLNRFRDLKIK